MTPRTIDWRTIGRKLRRIRELLDQLAALGPIDARRMVAEPITALALERIITLLVELAFSVNSHVAVGLLGTPPQTYAQSFVLAARIGMIDEELAAALRPSVGMRNVLVHEYLEVDQTVVAAAVPLALEHYGAYVTQTAAFMAGRTA